MKSAVKLSKTQMVAEIRLARLAVLLFAVALLFSVAPPVAAADAIEVGYAGPTYPGSTGGNGEPTGEKPESKLWWNDGSWWASMWSNEGNAYHIFKLNLNGPAWEDTGTALDHRNDSRADVLWDGNKLYVASHVFAKNAGAPADPQDRGMLYRYSYDSGSETYSLDNGYPVEITGGVSETLVLEKDANGKLWVTYVEDEKVMVNRSLNGDDANWGDPFPLPFDEANVSSDDISSIITYNQHVGIMWSNQATDRRMFFALHPLNAASDTAGWSRVLAYGSSGDDHISLKSLETDSEGHVYAVIKTSSNSELIQVLVCERNLNRCGTQGDWTSFQVYDGAHGPTRPILLIDNSNDDLYVFSRNKDGTHDAIYYKRTSLDNIQFDVDSIGTPFIKSAEDDGINDPTSTKQNLTSGTGLVVLASDSGPDRYFFNYMSLSGSATKYDLTVSVVGQGNVTLDPPGGEYDEGTTVSLTATPDPGWEFAGWSGDLSGMDNQTSIFMNGDKTVTATFVQLEQYDLTVETTGQGNVSLDPSGGTYYEGTEVTLTATPDAGWQFDSWSGAASGTDPETTVTMDGHKTVTAEFSQVPQYTLTVETEGNGSVTPSGGTYDEGTEVELEAIPDSGWEFSGWSGALTGDTNPETVVMDGNKTITAHFTQIPQYTLTVVTDGNGSVSPDGGAYEEGTEVTLTATADAGWQFGGWSGDASGSGVETTVTMDGDKTVTATFTEIPPAQYTLTVNVEGEGSVTPDGGVYEEGTEVTLTATPDTGWQFAGWSGAANGTDLETTITMDGDKAVTAAFTEIPEYTLTVNTVGNGSVTPDGGVYEEGTEVMLTATPDTGWQFVGWSGDLDSTSPTVPITMDGDKTVTATFSPIQRELTVTELGGGAVAVDPPGGVYDHGASVTLTANAESGWTFNSWSGDLTGTENPTTITMDADKEINATFVRKETGIQIEISARPMTATVGQVISYTYVVANIGEATLNDIVVVDDRLGAVTLDRTTLTSGETATGRLSYVPSVDDLPGPLQNMGTASGTSVLDEEVSDSGTISVALRQLSFVYYMPLGFSSAPAETAPNVEQATRTGAERVANYLAAPQRWTARR